MRFIITRESARAAEIATCTDKELDEAIPACGLTVTQIRNGHAKICGNDIHFLLCSAIGAPDRILQEHAFWCMRENLNEDVRLGRKSNWPVLEAIGTARKYCHGRATVAELESAQEILSANGFKSCLFIRYSASEFSFDTAWAVWCLGNLSWAEISNDLADRLIEEERKCPAAK